LAEGKKKVEEREAREQSLRKEVITMMDEQLE
jgi:hypothetical protein